MKQVAISRVCPNLIKPNLKLKFDKFHEKFEHQQFPFWVAENSVTQIKCQLCKSALERTLL